MSDDHPMYQDCFRLRHHCNGNNEVVRIFQYFRGFVESLMRGRRIYVQQSIRSVLYLMQFFPFLRQHWYITTYFLAMAIPSGVKLWYLHLVLGEIAVRNAVKDHTSQFHTKLLPLSPSFPLAYWPGKTYTEMFFLVINQLCYMRMPQYGLLSGCSFES